MPPGPRDTRPRAIRAVERRVHAAALRALDLGPDDREGVVRAMFARRRRDAVSYWLQLLLSMGIATVGLVLGSTAVVIGAMLIAPLMGPIVELGMGLVVGSPLLTLRSFGRMAGSVLATVGGAALLTKLLPFHEVTAEVASRTSPTALDLLLAILVAVAAAFTTARPGSESTSAAAGTAIGIALVPPACVIGFGLGIGDLEVTRGATLLFLTNITAILLVSVLFFWTLGFERVNAEAWEEAALAEADPNGWTRGAMRSLRAVFGSRWGRAVRVGLPLALVAAVFVPLSEALEQVAWEVRARTAVGRIVNEATEERRAVQTQVSVAPGAVSAQLYLVGSGADAEALERELVTRIAAETGVVPTVRVVSVADAGALRQAAGTRDAPAATPPPADLGEVRDQLAAAVRGAWPAELGTVVSWRLEVPDSARPVVRVEHLGSTAGPAAEALLSRAVSARIGTDLGVRTRAYASEAASAPAEGGEAWLAVLRTSIDAAVESGRLHACVTIPADSLLTPSARGAEVARRARAETARLDTRAAMASGNGWSVRLSPHSCAPAAVPAPARPSPADSAS